MVDSDFTIDMAWRMDALHQMNPGPIGGRWHDDPVLSQAKEVQCLLAIRQDVASTLTHSNTLLAKADTILSNQTTILNNLSTALNGIGTIKNNTIQIINLLTNAAPSLTAEQIRTIIREELDRPPTP